MDFATVLGIATGFGLVLGAIAMTGNPLAFVDVPSVLIVLGGTFGAVLVNYPMRQILGSFSVARNAFMTRVSSASDVVSKLASLSAVARRDGLLAIEPQIRELNDSFTRRALQLLIDGMDAQTAEETLRTELDALRERHRQGADVFTALGTFAPALGLIGTLIGLVQMLGHMDDPSTIGPSMAVALLTTFYGAMLSYLCFHPLAGKLRTRSHQEVLVKEMVISGVVGISKGENPYQLEQQLQGFLSPRERTIEMSLDGAST